MPVTATFQHKNVVSLDNCDNVVVALEPIVTTGVNPTNIMSTVCRSAFMSDNTD